ncbi:hypothetical protein NT6N_02190 [Oceaniferula spumae]|uniref:FecR protein domain-containing protein n=1 Tax=Oceaniferula spumae TaxID=2979115 RepID=A0AAT9FGS9_9BACT
MNISERDRLIQELIEGTISDSDFELITQELRDRPEALSYYRELVGIHNLLGEMAAERRALKGIMPIESMMLEQKKKVRKMALYAAAAVLVIAAISMSFFLAPSRTQNQRALTFATSPGTQFELTHPKEGEELEDEGNILTVGSRLVVNQGVVELTFETGVKSVIMAPADLTLHERDRLYMRQGRGWFHIPSEATGFTVLTADLKVVDLGTEFGVVTNPDEDDEVHVFEGRVQVTSLKGRLLQRELTKGDAIVVKAGGRLIASKSTKPKFFQHLPQRLPYHHWSFDAKVDENYTATGNVPWAKSLQSVKVKCDQVPGKFGQGLSFDGVDDYLETNWPGVSGSQPRAVSFWVKIPKNQINQSSYDSGCVGWGLHSGSGNHRCKLFIASDHELNPGGESNHVVQMTFNQFWYVGTTQLNDGDWHHVAASYMGRSDENGLPAVDIYIDGQLETCNFKATDKGLPVEVDTLTAKNSPFATPLTFGSSLETDRGQRRFFRGELDEIFLIEGSISAAQVQCLYRKNSLPDELEVKPTTKKTE